MKPAIERSVGSDPLRRRLRRLTPGQRREEAAAFLELYHREAGLSAAQHRARWREVSHQLARCGGYEHTREELAFGARIAWRNSARCTGRRVWRGLEVIDCRQATASDQIASCVIDHLDMAVGAGGIRSVISIFAAASPSQTPSYIENGQVVQFAGYLQPGRKVLGDPQNVEFTNIAMTLGWKPPAERGAFDVLPLMIRRPDGSRALYEIPKHLHRLVTIGHPRFPAVSELGLKWCPTPLVSDMILTIGGLDYPCAPFNGYFMSSEIASRNLVDEFRYDLLEEIGAAVGVDRADPLWKDRATVELNAAVLDSFRTAGVTIVDHHAANDQFIDFIQAEKAAGRQPSADWSWIVPPIGGGTCPAFHLPMNDLQDVPNFYRSRATDGATLSVSHITERQSRLKRIRRRVINWYRARHRSHYR